MTPRAPAGPGLSIASQGTNVDLADELDAANPQATFNRIAMTDKKDASVLAALAPAELTLRSRAAGLLERVSRGTP